MSLALTEGQIVRYSRQILLPQVGGHGQEKFLSQTVELVGRGGALATAAAYLAASGMGVRTQQDFLMQEPGFLFGAAPVAWSVNADATAAGFHSTGMLGELPAQFTGPAPWVALGEGPAGAAVFFRGEMGCSQCFQKTIEGAGPSPEGCESVYLGTLGALAYQRLVLGFGPPLGGCWVGRDGTSPAMEVKRCPACL